MIISWYSISMKTTYCLYQVLLALAISAGCAKSTTNNAKISSLPYVPCTESVPIDDPTKDDVLVIGDSISIGYTPTVKAAFPQYEIVHNLCNGMTSVNGLSHLDEWVGMRKHWRVATFNHGLWDIVPDYNVSPTAYREALIIEGTKLKQVADHVIFFTTTYVPPGTENRDNDMALYYTTIAIEVMQQLNIPVVDLYAVSRTLDVEHATDNPVHFTDYGYSVLGQAVVGAISPWL